MASMAPLITHCSIPALVLVYPYTVFTFDGKACGSMGAEKVKGGHGSSSFFPRRFHPDSYWTTLSHRTFVYALLPVRWRCRAMTEAQAGAFLEPAILIYCGLSPVLVYGGTLRRVIIVRRKSNR